MTRRDELIEALARECRGQTGPEDIAWATGVVDFLLGRMVEASPGMRQRGGLSMNRCGIGMPMNEIAGYVWRDMVRAMARPEPEAKNDDQS